MNQACFEEGYTVSNYLEECRAASPVVYSHAEACEYLSCLHYQSCESPEWNGSKVQMWILESKAYLAGKMADQILGDRHVWEARDPEPAAVPA